MKDHEILAAILITPALFCAGLIWIFGSAAIFPAVGMYGAGLLVGMIIAVRFAPPKEQE